MRLQERLAKDIPVTVKFEPYRLEFDNRRSPDMGSSSAAVTLVEFSDFQCPFCRQFSGTLKKVADKYGDRVRIVYRQFPIASIHPYAVKAAEASLCAHDDGKFWEFHDALFADQAHLSLEDLKSVASRVGVNRKAFDACVDGAVYASKVASDIREGERAGVTGTPAIFVNGVEVRGGAVPFETVMQAVDLELARVRKPE
jgi:protein-disulfide isomerase